VCEKTLSVKGEPIDLWYSGKAYEHGGNIQALCAPDGFPWWVSDVEPGSVHDLTVAREHVLGALNWPARSRIRNRKPSARSPRSISRLRAC
jgi:hypothetical protein